eukprot:1179907-Prorocentrum_minimum.AAC.1
MGQAPLRSLKARPRVWAPLSATMSTSSKPYIGVRKSRVCLVKASSDTLAAEPHPLREGDTSVTPGGGVTLREGDTSVTPGWGLTLREGDTSVTHRNFELQNRTDFRTNILSASRWTIQNRTPPELFRAPVDPLQTPFTSP